MLSECLANIHLVQPPAQFRNLSTIPDKQLSSHFWKTSSGALMTSGGRLIHCLIAPTARKLLFKLNFHPLALCK